MEIIARPHMLRTKFQVITVTIAAMPSASQYSPIVRLNGAGKAGTASPTVPPVKLEKPSASSTMISAKAIVASAK